MHESPAHDRASADALDVENDSSGGGGHGRAVRRYDDERNPPVIVAQWQRFPPSPERGFAIAAALGQFLDANGSSATRLRARDWYGSLVSPQRLPAVLEAIGVSDRTWRRYAARWESLYLAHRCGPLQVCLFTRPLPDRCPACQVELERDHVPARRPETVRDGSGRFRSNGGPERSGAADQNGPFRGRKRSAEAVDDGRKRSVNEHESDAPSEDGHNGKALGQGDPLVSEDGPCPDCGARYAVPGYWGHGMRCPRVYPREASRAS